MTNDEIMDLNTIECLSCKSFYPDNSVICPHCLRHPKLVKKKLIDNHKKEQP